MKKSKNIISVVMLIVIAATVAFWTVFFSNMFAPYENKIDNGVFLSLVIALLTVIFEVDIWFDLVYLVSDKSEKTKLKNVLNIICIISASIFTVSWLVGFARLADWLPINFAVMYILVVIVPALIVCVISRTIYILCFLAERSKTIQTEN